VRGIERGGKAIDVAVNLFGGKGDGRERILDLVSDTAGDFFPRGLFLGAEEFGGVLEHEDVTVVAAVGAGASLKQSDVGQQIHGAGVSARSGDVHFSRSGAHSVAAADEVVESLEGFGRENALQGRADEVGLASGIEHFGKRSIGEDDATAGVECGDAVGDGLEHGLKLVATGFEGGVGGGELEVGGLGGAAAVLEVGSHLVEAAHELTELFSSGLGDAMPVVAGGDCLHCIAKGFDGFGDLFGKMKCDPCAGEERQASEHEEQQHI